MDNFDWLKRMPWTKLLVTNLLGFALTIYYLHSVMDPKFDALNQKVDTLILHLVSGNRQASRGQTRSEQRVSEGEKGSALEAVPSAYGEER